MTDDNPNDNPTTRHELASAYLDDVASPAERDQVEASPELLALVATFTSLRAQLADVSPTTSVDAREAALAAALAEFDAPANTNVGATVTALKPKRGWAGSVLSVAAAVLLVGVVGVAVRAGLSGDGTSSSASDGTNAKVAEADAATELEVASDTMAASAPSTIDSIGGSAQTAIIIDTLEQLRNLGTTQPPVAVAPDSTVAASETTASESTDTRAANTTSSYARAALGCLTTQQQFLADIQYQSIFAIAARDTVTGMISAISDDCTVLATVAP